MTPDSLDLLTLLLTPGLGQASLRRLLKDHTPAEVGRLPSRRLQAAGLSERALEALRCGESRRQATRELKTLDEQGDRLLVLGAADYPQLLSRIPDPPPVLWIRGDPDCLYLPSVAVVGARRCTPYGREVASGLAGGLSARGLAIVSGLARGVDRAAHEGALERDGRTIAVLGTGLDVVYPRSHRGLQDRIGRQGCLVTELPLGTPPRPGHFPSRNRILSGLCVGTLVVEGTGGSGSLITAASALDQDRELWAVPGPVTAPMSEGPNRLIQQGAQPVLDEQDVVDRLPAWALAMLLVPTPGPEAGLSASETAVLELLHAERATHFDEVAAAFEGSHSQLSSVLLKLEMKGLARSMAGDRFSRRWYPDRRNRDEKMAVSSP